MATTIFLALLVLLVGLFILSGLRKISANPPCIGQLTIWGKRKTKWDKGKEVSRYKKEGWTFLPLYPLWYSVILINVERITFTVTIKKVRTPDRAESEFPVLVTIIPNKEMLINYINSGKEAGVIEQFTGKIQERIREWCMGPNEGPSDWIELNKSQSEGTYIIMRKIAGGLFQSNGYKIPKWAQDVPTWIWLRFYLNPKPEEKNLLKNEFDWGKDDWKKIRDLLSTHANEEEELKTVIEKRRNIIDDIRAGLGKVEIEDLGIILQRLNIGDINVLGDVATAAEKEAREKQERESEGFELSFVLEQIRKCMNPPFNYSPEKALEIVQTERGKVPKSIQETVLSISAETRATLERTLSDIGKQVLEMLSKKGGI